jgi:hypothetical protein
VARTAILETATVTLRSATKTFILLALALPVVHIILVWTAGILTGTGDAEGAAFIRRVGLVCQVVWVVSLVGLVMVTALTRLNEGPPEGE